MEGSSPRPLGSPLSAPNLCNNPTRIDTFQNKLKNKDPFIMIDGSSVVFNDCSENIEQLNKIRKHKPRTSYVFKSINNEYFPLSDFLKNHEFGSNKSINSQGKALADAGERATILSFYKELNIPEDTQEQLFIENPSAFERWRSTFINTKEAIEDILGKGFEFEYNVIHDSTSNGDFGCIISEFVKRIKINKDSWNPSDIWLISKRREGVVNNSLSDILANSKDLIEDFNNKIYELFKLKYLIPVSLKQITSKKYNIEFSNEPGKEVISYNIDISSFITDLSPGTKEIGSFVFINRKTHKSIRMQTKGYPFASVSTQTEITSDGSETGGRIGKVPAGIIDSVYSDYGFFRIKPSSYFSDNIHNTPKEQINEWVKWYETVSQSNKTQEFLCSSSIEQYIINLLESFKCSSQHENIQAFKHKIQGLAMQYFFIKNQQNIGDIMTRFILGAKKIDSRSSFFVKVY